MKRQTATALGALALLAVAAFVAFSSVTIVTPAQMTHTAIAESFWRMRMYLAAHHAFPSSLDDLPKRDGYVNRTTDGWRRSLIYKVEEDSFVTLLSLGRDGQPGGTGDDADIRRTYRTRNPDGTWCVDDDRWIVTAEVRDTPATPRPPPE